MAGSIQSVGLDTAVQPYVRHAPAMNLKHARSQSSRIAEMPMLLRLSLIVATAAQSSRASDGAGAGVDVGAGAGEQRFELRCRAPRRASRWSRSGGRPSPRPLRSGDTLHACLAIGACRVSVETGALLPPEGSPPEVQEGVWALRRRCPHSFVGPAFQSWAKLHF